MIMFKVVIYKIFFGQKCSKISIISQRGSRGFILNHVCCTSLNSRNKLQTASHITVPCRDTVFLVLVPISHTSIFNF